MSCALYLSPLLRTHSRGNRTFANWTGTFWNLRIHGAAYKQAMPSNDTLDSTADKFISNIPMSSVSDFGLLLDLSFQHTADMDGTFFAVQPIHV